MRVSHSSAKSTGGMTLNVVLESPGEDEAVQCSVGNHPLTLDFLRLLGDPAATA